MRDEEHPLKLFSIGVEGAQPGLAETRGEHDHSGLETLFAGGLERDQGLLLDDVRAGASGAGSSTASTPLKLRSSGTRRRS